MSRANESVADRLERLRTALYHVAESRADFTFPELVKASQEFDAMAIMLMKQGVRQADGRRVRMSRRI